MDQINNSSITNKTLAFIIRGEILSNCSGLAEYLKNEYPAIDIITSKLNYLEIQCNGQDIKSIVEKYLVGISFNGFTNTPKDVDLEQVISENVDMFFDIRELDDGTYTIELEESV